MIQFNLSVVCESVLSDEVHVNKIGHVVQKVSVRDSMVTFQQLSLLRCDEYGYTCCPALFDIPHLSVCAMGLVNESAG